MNLALAVFAVAGFTAIGHLTWGAILVGREYDAEERLRDWVPA